MSIAPASPDILRDIDKIERELERVKDAFRTTVAGGGGGAPSGPAGGVLAGTYPNPGFAQDMATQVELDAKENAGVAIPKALLDAKGDILTATANDTPARLAVGTNGHALVADSAQTAGVKWAAPAPASHAHAQSDVTNLTTDLANKQPLDSELSAIAGLVSAADRLPYFTGLGTAALATFTSFGRSLIDDVDAAAARTTLGAAAASHSHAQSDVTNLVTDLANKQPLDSELTALAGLTSAADRLPYFTGAGAAALATFTTFARTLMDDGDAATARATLGAAAASHAHAQADITNLTTDLANKQPLDAELTALAGLASTADRLPYFTGAGTAALATFTPFGRSLVDDADAAAGRATLGAASTADLATKLDSTLFDAKGDLLSASANDTPARLGVGSNGQVLTADSAQALGIKWADPTGGGTSAYDTTKVGTVLAWTSNTIPNDCVLAAGQSLTEANYPELCAFAATEVAAGNPLWTVTGVAPNRSFTVPNLQDRFLYGKGAKTLGTVGGTETHTLTEAQMPSHSHTVVVRNATGGTASQALARSAESGTTATVTGGMSAVGGGAAHPNMPPYVVMAWIIKAKGVEIIDPTTIQGPQGAPAATPHRVITVTSATQIDVDNLEGLKAGQFRITISGAYDAAGGERYPSLAPNKATGANMVGTQYWYVGAGATNATAPTYSNERLSSGAWNSGIALALGRTWQNSSARNKFHSVFTMDARDFGQGHLNVSGNFFARRAAGDFAAMGGYFTGWNEIAANTPVDSLRFFFGQAFTGTITIESTTGEGLGVPPTLINTEAWNLVTGFTNSWVNFGAPFSSAAYRMTPDGKVHLRGVIKSGTISSFGTAPAFLLPDGYRPPTNSVFAIHATNDVGRVDVNANGEVHVVQAAGVTYVSLDGISFFTD